MVNTNYQYKFNHTMNNMKKIFLGLAAALMLTACNENRQPEATTSVDSASVVTDLMNESQKHPCLQGFRHQP